MMEIWVVSEGSPGHVSQSRGLAEVLASLLSATIEQVEVRQRGRGWMRGIFRFLYFRLPQFRVVWVVFCARIGSLPDSFPSVLISSGGKSVFAARFLADKFKVPLVYCGTPTPYPDSWFECILSTEKSVDGNPNWIQTDVLVNSVTPEIVEGAAHESLFYAECLSNTVKIGAVLVGGQSRSSRYEEADWLKLADKLNQLSVQEGWRWLIATSRRTGQNVEKALKTALNSEYILDAVWWSEDPRKVIRAYVGLADRVWVGRDSMTMVSEAVCSGRPVIVYEPEKTVFSALMENFLDNLYRKKLIKRFSISDLVSMCEVERELEPFQASPVPVYAESVVKLLKL